MQISKPQPATSHPLITQKPVAQPTTPVPRAWIGHWLMAVAALHTVFALIVFQQPLFGILQRGVFNTVGRDPLAAATVWFLLFGVVLALLALAVTTLERNGQAQGLRQLGMGVLALTACGVILMPASGFWLVIPAGVALLRRGG